jgi:hypothetical protein
MSEGPRLSFVKDEVMDTLLQGKITAGMLLREDS